MGLAERRRIAAIAKDIEEAQAQLREVAGYDLPLQLELSTFPEIPEILDGYDSYKVYCLPMVVNIFRSLLGDDLGRQAVSERISAIQVKNTSTSAQDGGEMKVFLDGKDLVIHYGFYGWSDKVWGEDALRQAIENLL